MSAQIAPTPVIRGEEAKIAWKQANTPPTPKAKKNAELLLKYFENRVK